MTWVREHWKPILKFVPKVLSLVNGWVLFQFLYEEDRLIIKGQYWVISQGSLVLSHWQVGFDPRMERLIK